MDYQLIPLAHEHLGQAAEIERLCFSDPWSEKMLAEHLANPCSLTLAAVDGAGRLLGYVGLLAVVDEGYITNVAVRPDCRRQGVASALLGGLLNGAPLEEACALATEFTWRTIETTFEKSPDHRFGPKFECHLPWLGEKMEELRKNHP